MNELTYTLRFYRSGRSSWSYALVNNLGGSSSEGTFRSKASIIRSLAFRPPTAPIVATETYHWTGSDYKLIARHEGKP